MVRSVSLVCGENTTTRLDSHFKSPNSSVQLLLYISTWQFSEQEKFSTCKHSVLQRNHKITFSKNQCRKSFKPAAHFISNIFLQRLLYNMFSSKEKFNRKNLEPDFHFCSKSLICRAALHHVFQEFSKKCSNSIVSIFSIKCGKNIHIISYLIGQLQFL